MGMTALSFDAAVDRAFRAGNLDDLTRIILQAKAEKTKGYGPPEDDIRKAVRKFNELYAARYPQKVK